MYIKPYINIIMLHVDINYFACWGQNYASIPFAQNMDLTRIFRNKGRLCARFEDKPTP